MDSAIYHDQAQPLTLTPPPRAENLQPTSVPLRALVRQVTSWERKSLQMPAAALAEAGMPPPPQTAQAFAERYQANPDFKVRGVDGEGVGVRIVMVNEAVLTTVPRIM
jgi:hypothetical protein